MIPPVSLPLTGGTQSARAGTDASATPAAIRTAALMIRMVRSVSLLIVTLECLTRREKNASEGQDRLIGRCCRAALDLGGGSRHGSPALSGTGGPCAARLNRPQRTAPAWR